MADKPSPLKQHYHRKLESLCETEHTVTETIVQETGTGYAWKILLLQCTMKSECVIISRDGCQ